MLRRSLLGAALGLLATAPAWAKHHHRDGEAGEGLSNATLLLVRHAEKPEEGQGLTPAGEARAKAYVDYFRRGFWTDEPSHRIDALVATLDTAKSMRPRLTIEPLSHATGLPIQQPCEDHDVKGLARWLAAQPPARTTLIAWHHGTMPKLLAELGADPTQLLPGGVWPGEHFDWVIELRYDAEGRLVVQRKVVEGF